MPGQSNSSKGPLLLIRPLITIKILQEFSEALYLRVDVESKLGKEEVLSRQTRVMVRKGYNFWSDRWISIKVLQEFFKVIFLGVDLESLHGEATVWSSQTRVMVQKGHNFWSDRWSRSNFHRSFQRPFSMEWMWNRHTVRRKSGRARLEYPFERAITFDPIVGSWSNFYKSFSRPFSPPD